MKKIFKLFLNPIQEQEIWINKMASQGYRLVDVSKWTYSFEKCKPNEYEYKIDYVGNENYKTLQDYQQFLEEVKIKYYSKSMSIGRYSFGRVKFRPWGNSNAKWSTSKGMLNRELLILEKKNDGRSFEVHSTLEDKVNALKSVRKPLIYTEIFLFSIVAYLLLFNKSLINYSIWSLNMNFPHQYTIFASIFGVIIIYLGYKIVRLNLGIKELKERMIINE